MTDFGGKTSIFSHPVYLFLRKFSLQDSRGGSDIAGTPEAVDVLCLCLDIADQDGIGEQEEQALKKIAQALQLSLDAYL